MTTLATIDSLWDRGASLTRIAHAGTKSAPVPSDGLRSADRSNYAASRRAQDRLTRARLKPLAEMKHVPRVGALKMSVCSLAPAQHLVLRRAKLVLTSSADARFEALSAWS